MFVNLTVHQNPFRVVKKHTLPGPIPEVSDSGGLGGALKFAFLTGLTLLEGSTDMLWVEAKDAADNSIMQSTSFLPYNKELSDPNICSGEDEDTNLVAFFWGGRRFLMAAGAHVHVYTSRHCRELALPEKSS